MSHFENLKQNCVMIKQDDGIPEYSAVDLLKK